jgi:Bacterial toxin 4
VARRRLLANVEAAAYYQGQRLGVKNWAEFAAHPTVRRVLGDRLDRLSSAELKDVTAAWRRGDKLAMKVREPVPQPRSRRQQGEDPGQAPATPAAAPTPVQPPRPALVVSGGADARTAGLGEIRSISRHVINGEEEVTIDGYLAEGIKNRSVNAPNYNQDPIWGQLRDAYGLEGWQAAHLWGPGFGDEAAAGMYLAPEAANQLWQNHGVETFLRRLRNRAAQDGAVIRVRATARSYDATVAGGRTLQDVRYEFSAFTPHGEIKLGRVELSVGKPPAGRVSDPKVTQFSDW